MIAAILVFLKSLPALISLFQGLVALGAAGLAWYHRKVIADQALVLKDKIQNAMKPDKSIPETKNAACELEKQINPDSDCDKP